ncbi:hypothetical protein IFM89_009106 [Coptis chinensis]|uniref:F-box protein At3g26010-like beta-propeller domain-containing protein n=1 Tax=Coptis chinensis TaxID=261450 RepID=A0A835HPM0_9MAGN|nr:hypothetical protein IFM89_009106 [Coptis chinensis]
MNTHTFGKMCDWVFSAGCQKSKLGDNLQGLCRLHCFPPVAIAWYSTSGLHVIPNLYSETISVDSSPAFWDSTQESDMTTVLLLLDPHCSFTIGAGVSVTTAAGRFLLLYCSEIVGFSIAIIFFPLMRQARTWELDLPLPSLLAAVELNLRMPLAFLLLAILPIVVSLVSSLLIISESFPPLSSFFIVSIICYAFANGSLIILILTSPIDHLLHCKCARLYQNTVASLGRKCPTYFFQSVSQSFLQFLFTQGNSHPTYINYLGLLCSSGAGYANSAPVSCVTFSHCSLQVDLGKSNFKPNSGFDPLLPLEEKSPNSPNSTRSYGDTQIETFNHRHGLLMLHLLAVLMFVPSFVAWFQDIAPFQEMSKYVTFVNGNRVFTSSQWTSYPFLECANYKVVHKVVRCLQAEYPKLCTSCLDVEIFSSQTGPWVQLRITCTIPFRVYEKSVISARGTLYFGAATYSGTPFCALFDLNPNIKQQKVLLPPEGEAEAGLALDTCLVSLRDSFNL